MSGLRLDARHLRDAFSRIDQWGIPYIAFNLEYETAHAYVQKKMKENDGFKEFVQVRVSVDYLFIIYYFSGHNVLDRVIGLDWKIILLGSCNA
jgi:hypothetical protein